MQEQLHIPDGRGSFQMLSAETTGELNPLHSLSETIKFLRPLTPKRRVVADMRIGRDKDDRVQDDFLRG